MNISDITSGPVASVAELIDLSEKPEVQLEPAPSRDWAFRGQPADYGTLTPSFQRQFPWRSYGTAERIERRLIEAFRMHYKKLRFFADRAAKKWPLRGSLKGPAGDL